MTFGDGCSALYPLVSQDVVTHELGHGITDRYSDIYYSGQSGGINEAFSDMSGEVAELFSRNSNDWEVDHTVIRYLTDVHNSLAKPCDKTDILVGLWRGRVVQMRESVFALDVEAGATVVIDTAAGPAVQVTVYVTSDAAGSNVIASGPTPFVLDVTADAAYFKLASSTDVDVTVEVVS